MEQGVWQEIEQLYQKFQKLGISESVDYDKYYLCLLYTSIQNTSVPAARIFDRWSRTAHWMLAPVSSTAADHSSPDDAPSLP